MSDIMMFEDLRLSFITPDKPKETQKNASMISVIDATSKNNAHETFSLGTTSAMKAMEIT